MHDLPVFSPENGQADSDDQNPILWSDILWSVGGPAKPPPRTSCKIPHHRIGNTELDFDLSPPPDMDWESHFTMKIKVSDPKISPARFARRILHFTMKINGFGNISPGALRTPESHTRPPSVVPLPWLVSLQHLV